MSKELEPIEALDKLLDGYSRGMAGRSYYDIVREALERLEAIKNANPSEALEAFGRITLHTEYDNDSHYDGLHFEDDCKLVDKALLKAEKEHKALEIIKEKNVSVCGFRNRVFGYHSNMTINDTYEHYLNYFGCYHNGFDVELLTEEEFNLLKEVLE